ncbi:MAG: Coenzyme F420 hydrogenase/dehydrogenase, beta subunit C-terminal domain [Theionarchaea archaeon]|nr:Coenzyme F420 hydrogenase/dehydrogenase, beta subunit C-terminal domain [Theionarchaea archaeon]
MAWKWEYSLHCTDLPLEHTNDFIFTDERGQRVAFIAGYIMRYGPIELKEDVLQKNLCVRCGACVNLCPYIRCHEGIVTMIYPCDCTEGKCYAFCPRAEIDFDALSLHLFGIPYSPQPLGHYLHVYKSRTALQKGHFQSGGSVSSLVMNALQEYTVDAVVLTGTQESLPVPRVAETPGDVLTCSGSKFTATPTIAALNEAIHSGYQKIGVVATPCQCQAVTQMREFFSRNDMSDPITLVIGLFCMWAFDYQSFHSYVEEGIDSDTIVKMNVPPPPQPVLEVITESDTHEIPLDELRPFILPACTTCFDLSAEFSDISVGLFEGDPQWNTLITRTSQGDNCVQHAVTNGFLEITPYPDSSLQHLQSAALSKKRKGCTQLMTDGLINGHSRTSIRLDERTVSHILEEEP